MSASAKSSVETWHISKDIPLGFIFAIASFFLIQTGSILWYFAHQDSRLDTVEKYQSTATSIADKLQSASNTQAERLARLEEKVVSIQATANRIESLLTPVKTTK